MQAIRPEWRVARALRSLLTYIDKHWKSSYCNFESPVVAKFWSQRQKFIAHPPLQIDPSQLSATLSAQHHGAAHKGTDVITGYMLKTSSEHGPAVRLLEAGGSPGVGALQMIQSLHAHSPTHMRWWILKGPILKCYTSPDEPESACKLEVDLHHYMVVRVTNQQQLSMIALFPRALLHPPQVTRAGSPTTVPEEETETHKSWYLCGHPTTHVGEAESATDVWFNHLARRGTTAAHNAAILSPC